MATWVALSATGGAGYQWVRSVTHRKSAPLSLDLGAGLTTELDSCFSIPADDGKAMIAAAAAAARVVVERKCAPI